jgi:hypothetical protein
VDIDKASVPIFYAIASMIDYPSVDQVVNVAGASNIVSLTGICRRADGLASFRR